MLTDTLPELVEFKAVETAQGTCSEASGTLTCDLGSLNFGDSATVTITVTPLEAAAGSTITNTASVTSTLSDLDLGNNSASQSTFVRIPSEADLSLTKSGSPDQVPAGGTLTYELVVTNEGPSDALDVVVTDTLPTDVRFGLALANHGFCSEASGTVTCNVGNLDVTATAKVTITVSPTAAAANSSITNVARVTSRVTDPDDSNN